MSKQSLTPRQQQVYDFLVRRHRAELAAPCLREICAELGIRSACTAWEHLRSLERRGLVVCRAYESRGVQLASPPPTVREEREGALEAVAVAADAYGAGRCGWTAVQEALAGWRRLG